MESESGETKINIDGNDKVFHPRTGLSHAFIGPSRLKGHGYEVELIWTLKKKHEPFEKGPTYFYNVRIRLERFESSSPAVHVEGTGICSM